MIRARVACLGLALAVANLGCATSGGPDANLCALLGAVAGAGAGAAIGADTSSGSDSNDMIVGGSAGLVGGALVSWVLCKAFEPNAETAMAPSPPPPAPPPRRAAPPPSRPRGGEAVRERIVLRGVNFDFDKAEIRGDAAVILDEAASILNRTRGVGVRVEGHTDSTGPAAYNQNLSERRAAAVKRYLVERGVSASRLQTVGMGENNPIASNDTRDGRSVNRRVELQVLE